MTSRAITALHAASAAGWIATAALLAVHVYGSPTPTLTYTVILTAIVTLALTVGSFVYIALGAHISSYRIGYRLGRAEATPHLRLVQKDHA